MHQDGGTFTVPGHGRGGKFGQGKLSKVFLVLSTRKTEDTMFTFHCFSSVSNPPKANTMQIRVLFLLQSTGYKAETVSLIAIAL